MFKKDKKCDIMILGDSMASRMERYYTSDEPSKKRSQMNKKLYDSIYEEGEYSNIEAVATMSKPNEIDITKIKEMLKNREDYKKQKQYRQIMNKEEEKKETPPSIQFEEIKNYDVKELLNKAKSEVTDTEYRSLDNTNYNILKELKISKEKEMEEENQDLQEMIDSITNTSKLHKLDNRELGLDLLSDLKGNDETLTLQNDTIRALIDEAKKEESGKTDTQEKIDTSFYSASMNFNKKDFMDFEDIDTKPFYQSMWFKILIGVLLLLAIVVGIVVFII